MIVKIIGSAAGGGFPQWNCNYHLSRNARNAENGFLARTQSSIIASADGKRFVLFNASPDIRQQIQNTPCLHPGADGPLRSTPIAAVVLTNADVDHIAGLLTLRERQAFNLYATKRVLDVLDANPIFNVLNPDLVKRHILPLTGVTAICDVDGNPLDITLETFVVAGKIALFMENAADENFGSQDGDTVGLKIGQTGSNKTLFYIPGCAQVNVELFERVKNADCLLFDGTLFHDDEMLRAGLGPKTGKRMGHISMAGEQGSLRAWQDAAINQKIYVHINNSNPVLDDHAPERQMVEKAGWQVAFDGMEIIL